MAATDAPSDRRSFAELSRVVLGRPVSIVEAFDLLMAEEFRPEPPAASASALWLGSVGYERHKDSAEFAQMLRAAVILESLRSELGRVLDVAEFASPSCSAIRFGHQKPRTRNAFSCWC